MAPIIKTVTVSREERDALLLMEIAWNSYMGIVREIVEIFESNPKQAVYLYKSGGIWLIPDPTTARMPCCIKWKELSCLGCPICRITGQENCLATPWQKVQKARYSEHPSELFSAIVEMWIFLLNVLWLSQENH